MCCRGIKFKNGHPKNDQKSETENWENQKSETENQKSETENQKSEVPCADLKTG